MRMFRKFAVSVAVALGCAGAAHAEVIVLPSGAEGILDIDGPLSVAWVYSFVGIGSGLPEGPGGNICTQLQADECSVNGSAAIQKRNYSDGIEGVLEPGALFNANQHFTVNFNDDPFGDGASDGTWSYDLAPFFVTAWATKAGSDGYTVFYLVNDGTDAADAAYTGITALPGVDYPFGTFGLNNEQIVAINLSNITYFDSEDRVPPQQIPEPGTLLLLGAAVAGLGMLRRRRPG